MTVIFISPFPNNVFTTFNTPFMFIKEYEQAFLAKEFFSLFDG
jgi:hypothetical protein